MRISMEAHRQQRCSKKRSTTVRAQYAAQACQECRRRRAKCDGRKPLCARCLNRGLECVFNTRDDNRGTAPKSLVMQLQARIQQLEQVLWLHSIDIDSSIAQLKAGHLPPISSYSQQQSREEEPDGALCANGPYGLNDKDGGEEEVRFFGSSSGRVELLQSTPLHSNSELGSLPRTSLRSGMNRFLQDPDLVPPIAEELQEHLIALYFQWEQPWLQLVDEQLFRQSLRQEGRYCSPLLLHCILAMGARYSERLEVRSTPDDPNTAGESLLEVAEVLLHFDLRSPSITTIQSLGIMAIFYVAIGSDSKGWLRHGMAIRLALDMGLNLDSATLERTHRFPEVEIKLRRQIYWALYCTDKLWASYTGRVCTMLDSQSSVELPLSEAASDNSAPTQMLSMLLHSLSTHCQILGKILMKLYAPGKLPPGIQRTTFFDSCLLELKSWKYHLPVALQWKRASSRGRSSPIMPHILILHMVYNTSIIILAKPFLSKSSSSPFRTAAAASENRTMPGIPVATAAAADITRKASSLCVEASRDICLLGEHYRKIFGGFRQSPITAMHCTLSAALFLILDDHHHYHEEPRIEPDIRSKWIRSCLSTLRELGVSWTTATKYWHGLRCLLKDRDHQGMLPTRGLGHIEAIPSPRDSLTAIDCDDTVGEPEFHTPINITAEAAANGSSQWDQCAGQQQPSCLDMDATVHTNLTFEELLSDLPHDLGFLAAMGSSTPPDLWGFY